MAQRFPYPHEFITDLVMACITYALIAKRREQ